MTLPRHDKLKVLDLFSGIGGFSLGLERTGGFETVAFCEIDPYCRAVLRKHWPDVRQYEDVRELTAGQLRADGIVPDVICGGFPCQDISVAGKGGGIEAERSGLWREIARLAGELRPHYIIVENTAALLGRGLGRVLGDLATLGFDAEWHCIPASAVGAPHGRDRVWILANPDCRWWWTDAPGRDHTDRANAGRAKANSLPRTLSQQRYCGRVAPAANSDDLWRLQPQGRIADFWRWLDDRAPASPEWRTPWPQVLSEIQGMDDGLSSRLDKAGCDATGNAVTPIIPEIIGRAILAAEASHDPSR